MGVSQSAGPNYRERVILDNEKLKFERIGDVFCAPSYGTYKIEIFYPPDRGYLISHFQLLLDVNEDDVAMESRHRRAPFSRAFRSNSSRAVIEENKIINDTRNSPLVPRGCCGEWSFEFEPTSI